MSANRRRIDRGRGDNSALDLAAALDTSEGTVFAEFLKRVAPDTLRAFSQKRVCLGIVSNTILPLHDKLRFFEQGGLGDVWDSIIKEDTMESEINDILLEFAGRAGAIAVAEQERAKAQLKPDQSYVTNVDLRVSELSIQMLRAVIPEYHIITEEHLEHLAAVESESATAGDELLAIVDPLDGTRNYFHNMPLYGISVGILKNRVPWLGFVMFPALGEMVYCDGESSYFVRNALGANPDRVVLKERSPDLSPNSTMLCSEPFASRYRWDYEAFQLLQSGCATINLCWPLIGRGVGCMFAEHIWDLAGSWPTLAMLGFTLKGIHTGRQIDRFDPDDYDSDTQRLKEPVVISRPQHYERLAAAASPIN